LPGQVTNALKCNTNKYWTHTIHLFVSDDQATELQHLVDALFPLALVISEWPLEYSLLP